MKPSRVILTGRLGNQLWQIAFAHFLVSQGMKVKLTFLDEMVGRLSDENVAILEELSDVCNHGIEVEWLNRSSRISKATMITGSRIQRFLPKNLRPLDFRNFTADELLSFSFSGSRKLIGYFQSRQLLGGHIDVVREELMRILERGDRSGPEQEKGYRAVFHLRYGDYLHEIHKNDFGVLSYAYYEEILKRENLLASEVLWISDDPAGVKNRNSALNQIEVIGPDVMDVLTTGCVMSQTELLAISNSSLAWWFGLCAKRQGAKVYLPHPWRKSDMSIDTKSDVYESSDLLIPAKFLY